ncbi:MAG TPA: hypothetical protein PLF26_03875 [Blastocatellia bacterium]|nr:hypothetical protein [Blastocatellia bacterium]
MVTTTHSHRIVSALEALDNGAFREAIPRYEASEPSTDPIETLWRAEVALYLDRLEESAAELKRLPVSLDRDLANRAETIRAEIAFWDKALDESRHLVMPVVQSTWECGDHQGHLRASLLTARIELRRGNAAEFLEKAREPRRLATVLGNDFYGGIIAHGRAYAYSYFGDMKQAGHAFAEALHLLKKSEGLRWEASCRVLYASHLAELGRCDDAIAECDAAEKVAYDLGIIGDALWARTAAARTLLSLDRFEEIVTRLGEVLTWERATRHVFAELIALQVLAIAYCELGRYEEAERTADESTRLAQLIESETSALDGEMLKWWAAARRGASGAVGKLESIIERCDEAGTEYQRAEARLYVAQVSAADRPDIASAMCLEAESMQACTQAARLQNLLQRVQSGLSSKPIRVGAAGELIIDPKVGMPDYDTAVATLRRFLALEAVRRSSGNRADAARQLGLSRSRFHDLWLQIHGKPVRPERTPAEKV